MVHENILIQVQCEGDYWSWKISYPDGSNMTSGEEALSERGAWEEVCRRMEGTAPCAVVQEFRDERKALLARASTAEALLHLWQHFAAAIARDVLPHDECPSVGEIRVTDLGRISSAVTQMAWDKIEALHRAAGAKAEADKTFAVLRESREKTSDLLEAARSEGAQHEREAVIAWLKLNPGKSRAAECITAMTPLECADAISSGAHVRSQSNTSRRAK